MIPEPSSRNDLTPVRARVRAQVAAVLAAQPRAEPRHRHVVAVALHVDHAMVAAAPTEAPDAERAHAVGAHVAERHGQARVAHAKYLTRRIEMDTQRRQYSISIALCL
jgi:hypothetical protein